MLCKCSGKYIDIYFILKITYLAFAFGLIVMVPGKYVDHWALKKKKNNKIKKKETRNFSESFIKTWGLEHSGTERDSISID